MITVLCYTHDGVLGEFRSETGKISLFVISEAALALYEAEGQVLQDLTG